MATETERQGHASEHVREISDLAEIDAIVIDGLIYEVLNGLAQHVDPMATLNIPLAPIPAGSGNGLWLNLNGIEGGFDCTMAALNVIFKVCTCYLSLRRS